VVTGETVSPDAAEEQQDDDGDLPRSEHDPEVRGRAGQVEHGEGERHGRHRAARHRDRAAREEEPELAVT
jgi:hypothetical protein